jgi:hypothetical protein
MTDVAAAPASPRGIGGWLILPAIGTVISVGLSGYAALQSILTLQGVAGKSLPAGLLAFIWVELACQVAIGVGWIYAIVLLVKHKRQFPRAFIALLAISLLFNILDIIVAASAYNAPADPNDIRTIVRSVLALAIWAPYMLVSKRVRNTFVN